MRDIACLLASFLQVNLHQFSFLSTQAVPPACSQGHSDGPLTSARPERPLLTAAVLIQPLPTPGPPCNSPNAPIAPSCLQYTQEEMERKMEMWMGGGRDVEREIEREKEMEMERERGRER